MSEAGILVPQSKANVSTEPAHRILIIDDEAAIRESLETLLVLEGYLVDLAAEGQAGLKCIDTRSYDLVLLDLALPGQNGLEVLARIRERQPNLPVIMITAYGTVGNVVDAMNGGAPNFVQKPWANAKLRYPRRHRPATRGRRECPAQAGPEAALQL
jgi:DNA-binding NtrC family response regulator